MRLTIFLLSVFFFQYFSVEAQRQNFFSRSEIGAHVGAMYYIGDLNPFRPFYQANFAGGIMFRYHVHSRLTLRANFTSGKVEAYDSESKNPLNVNRNLQFISPIREIAAGVEFHYFPFQVGSSRHPATAYIIAQLGGFYMDPFVYYDGEEKLSLRKLGTEGQGSPLGGKRYSNYQLCVPLGLGVKMSLGKVATLNFDIAIRKTFTDYLDDVKSDFYVDPSALAAVNGAESAYYANRSLDGNRYGRRGNSTTKDWYVYAGGMLTIRLGRGRECSEPR
jgi:hypothetical protein